jgi:hypothetical protein
MNDDFYMILSSNNSLKYFPDNKSNHFVTVLPHEIKLPSTFKFALVDFLQPPSEADSTAIINYINCSISEPIISSNTYSNVIRSVAANKTKKINSLNFSNPFYIPIAHLSFNTIEIKITDQKGELAKFSPSNTVLTLHFKNCK